MKNKCLICFGETLENDCKFKNSVSTDSKFYSYPISHSFCKSCGYIFVNYKNRLNYKKFYKSKYNFLLEEEIEPTIDEKKYSEHLVNFFSEYLKDKHKTFFDIGAGKGNLLEAVHKKFPNFYFTALEPSKSFNYLKKIKFIDELYNNFFDSNNFKKKKFDFISLIGVLEHVPDPRSFLLDIKNIMSKNTLLLIEVPNFKNNKADLLTIDHLSKFTEQSIKNIFNVTGFEIIKKKINSTVPMQYIVKISNEKKINKINSLVHLNKAGKYLNLIFEDIKKISNKEIAFYGQNLVMEYILGSKALKLKNISCIIDDNHLYHGKLWNNLIPIISFQDFKKIYKTKNIFLAMSDCYHKKVFKKLFDYRVYGLNL